MVAEDATCSVSLTDTNMVSWYPVADDPASAKLWLSTFSNAEGRMNIFLKIHTLYIHIHFMRIHFMIEREPQEWKNNSI